MFYKKGVLRNLTKFTEKHLCQSLFFNEVAGLTPQACNFIKKETLAQVFSFEFYQISKNTFLQRTPLVAGYGHSMQDRDLDIKINVSCTKKYVLYENNKCIINLLCVISERSNRKK